MSETSQLVRVYIPDIKAQKCMVLNVMDSVWTAKQIILDKVYQELKLNPLNYSLYIPASGQGKMGKYMVDSHLLIDYALEGNVPKLELKYKRRDFASSSLTEKAILKANTKTNQRKLLEHTIGGSVRKIEKLLEAGLDPNFATEDGNTPLGLACGRNSSTGVILPLLSGGAHIDFRGKDGLTPMHRAAIGGNAQAINILLSFGASPNYRDAKGLSPLYHTAIMGDDAGSCISLLRYRAELGIRDPGGWTELHHTAKYGHKEHANLLIRYGADINAQNLVGNTPLHVAASHGQTNFAKLLLKRGADKMKLNYANQTPSQVSVLCGQHQLAAEINAFTEASIERITLPPDYNPNAKKENKLYDVRRMSEICPIRPTNKELAGTLSEDWVEARPSGSSAALGQAPPVNGAEPFGVLEHPKMMKMRKETSASSGGKEYQQQQGQSSEVAGGDADSVNSLDVGSNHSGSTVGTPTLGTPKFRRPSFQQQRERLYRAGPEQYLAIQDVEAQQSGDIPLSKGVAVEVTYIGRGGYWEGRSAGKEGWFPRLAIKELGDEEFDYSTLTRDVSKTKTKMTTSSSIPSSAATPSSMVAQNSSPKTSVPPTNQHQQPLGTQGTPSPPPDASPNAHLRIINTLSRRVNVVRGGRGYGFAMRGVKATRAMQFHPTPEVPSLQYVGNVEEGGAAAEAGLKPGDFIVEVNRVDTTYSTHDEVVNIVRKSGGTLAMKVITPVIKPKSVSMQIRNHLTPVSTPDLPLKNTEAAEAQPAHYDSPKSSKLSNAASFAYDSPKRRPASGGDVSSPMAAVGRETVIGEDSPAIPRRGNFEWDSQGEESPAIHRRGDGGGGFAEDPAKSYYGLKSSILSNSPSHQSRASPGSKVSPPRSKSYAGITITGGGAGNTGSNPIHISGSPSPTISAHKARLGVTTNPSSQSLTLPANLQPSMLSEFASADFNDKDEEVEESSFAMALKMSKKKLQKSPSHQNHQKSPVPATEVRARSNTMPRKDDKPPSQNDNVADEELETESLSILQRELKRASEERSKRMSRHQEKVTELPPPAKQLEKKASATLATVLSERFDTMHLRIKSPDNCSENSSDFEDSPAVAAKMPIKKTMSVPAGFDAGSKTPEKLRGPPPSVKPKPTKKKTDPSISSIGEAASPTSGDEDAVKEENCIKQEEEQNAASNMFDVKLHPTSKASREEAPLATTNATKKLPPAVAPKKALKKATSMDEKGPNGVAKPEQKEGFLLPPPLAASVENEDNRRISFVDLEPPDAFNSDEAAFPPPPPPQLPSSLPPPPPKISEEDGSSHSSVLAPLPSLPPPPPTTAPPQKVESTSEVFVFETEEERAEDIPVAISSPLSVPTSLASPLLDSSSDNLVLPSPIPSPVPNRFSSSNLSTSPLPPPAFGGNDDAVQQEGFWIDDPSSSLVALPTIPPFSPQSEASEPSEAPPPLPSEPPPDLDSDASAEKFSGVVDSISGNETGEISSTGSSPVTYMVLASEEKKESKVAGTPPGGESTMATKEPTKGFLVREPEVPHLSDFSPSSPSRSLEAPPSPVATPIPPPSNTKAMPSPPPVAQGFNTLPMGEWSTSDVCDWLHELGLADYVPSFQENEMMGEHLLDITRDDLKELGVKKMGHQKTILSRLSQLNK